MNYLAHLHLAHIAGSDLLGNLLGDFVKGEPYRQFSTKVANGIVLHRAIDGFTDSHPSVRLARNWFAPERKRFALIALDMFWDHCLAKNWREFSDVSLDEFVCAAERAVSLSQSTEQTLPARFIQVNRRIWQEGWLASYQDIDNLVFALERMSLRSERLAPLAETHYDLLQHYDALEQLHAVLYSDLKVFAQQKSTAIEIQARSGR